MPYSHAKVKGQWSVSSENRVETNGRTDKGNRITSLANVVGNNGMTMMCVLTQMYFTLKLI